MLSAGLIDRFAAHRHTDRQPLNKNSIGISAIYSVHLTEIVIIKFNNRPRCFQVLKMSSASLHRKMDAGYVISLMSVDALKLSQMVRALHEVVTLPIYLALAAYFLYFNLQTSDDRENRWSSLIGMAVMVTVVPVTTCIVAWKTKHIQAYIPLRFLSSSSSSTTVTSSWPNYY